MPTAFFSEYVTLGGLMLGSKAIECFDWSDLRGTAKRHPGNFVVQGVAGRTARAPVEDELEATLQIRVNGLFDQDNARVAVANRMSNFYTLRGLLFAKLETNTTQSISLTRSGGTDNGTCQVIAVSKQKVTGAPYIGEWAATVLVPAGALL